MLGVAGVAPPHTKVSKIKGFFLKNSFLLQVGRPCSGVVSLSVLCDEKN
jgi:hypothetical protein